jgi:TonB family protein
MVVGLVSSSARPGLSPQALREWSAGALGAVTLHAALAAAIVIASSANQHEMMPRPELAVELDMDATAAEPKLPQPTPGAGGGGAGGAIASAVPLPASYKPVAPIIPPEFIEPVKGAPVARTSGADGQGLPLGYGPGFGGGMGGGIGGGIGKGIGSGSGSGLEVPSPPPPPPKPEEPVATTMRYNEISTARYARLIVYPPAALEQQEQGSGVLAVILTPEGKVVRWYLQRSTGKPRLDAEIRRVAAQVDQLDPLPAANPHQRMVARIPITFRLGGSP